MSPAAPPNAAQPRLLDRFADWRLGDAVRLCAWSLALFLVLALLVRYGVLAALDDRILLSVQARAPSWMHDLGRLVNLVGGFERQALLVVVLAAIAFAAQRYLSAAAFLLLLTTTMVEVIVKHFLFFPRAEVVELLRVHPSDLPQEFAAVLPTLDTAVFPSGHVARATFLCGLLLFLALRRLHSARPRLVVTLLILAAMLVTGVTRVVLDEHFPSDVVGGYLLGLAALAPALWLLSLERRRLDARRAERPRAGTMPAGSDAGGRQ